MSSHTGANFLNSCLKVPIDPCNNCPAPGYNRPKIYLGRSATACSKLTANTSSNICDYDLHLDTLFDTNEVRSLAKFYDSIPDYCDLNHLPEQEFYSTLETLKSTCHTLKSKASPALLMGTGSYHSFSTSRSCNVIKTCKTKVHKDSSSKSSKRRNRLRKSCTKKECRSVSTSPCVSSFQNLCERMRILSYKRCDDLNTENISKQRSTTPQRDISSLHKSFSVRHLPNDDFDPIKRYNSEKDKKSSAKYEQQIPLRTDKQSPPITATTPRFLKKSFSFNDLRSPCLKDEMKKDSMMRNSQYLDGRIRTPSRTVPEKTTVQSGPSPNSPANLKIESPKANTNGTTFSARKKRTTSKQDSKRVPFSFLGINECKLMDKIPSASPVHPVARPNLAATLRAEVSKKKVKELQSNCTYTDRNPQIDWEVRKTPAWKSLSLNESHTEILALRLATRKAEQALQKREYELHMELMKQRVKSAPLLLEGTTYWGPHVGKLSHSCHKDSLRHPCQSGKKQRRKINSSKSQQRTTCSRNSNNSTNMRDSDDLCSLDRAYL